MLIITFHNDGTGKPIEKVGNYDVQTFVNKREIYRGRVEGHLRQDWRDLIIQWAEQLKEEKILHP
jgi:hypothetical protein